MVMAHKPRSPTPFVPYGGEQRHRVDFKTVRRVFGHIQRWQNADNARFFTEKQPANLCLRRLRGFRQDSLPRGS